MVTDEQNGNFPIRQPSIKSHHIPFPCFTTLTCTNKWKRFQAADRHWSYTAKTLTANLWLLKRFNDPHQVGTCSTSKHIVLELQKTTRIMHIWVPRNSSMVFVLAALAVWVWFCCPLWRLWKRNEIDFEVQEAQLRLMGLEVHQK
jgi:hypothetical protein